MYPAGHDEADFDPDLDPDPDHSTDIGRRGVLAAGTALATTALSYRRVLGANDRIRLGVIGTGQRAQSLMKRLKELPGNEQVAVCDVYEPRLLEAVAMRRRAGAKQNVDHRAVLDSKDIDGVVIGSPQHWHKQMTLDALAADKDVFLEKCVSHTIDEGVEMVKAVGGEQARRADRHPAAQPGPLHPGRGAGAARASSARSTSSTPTGTRTSPTASTPTGSPTSSTGSASPARRSCTR